MHGLHAKYMIDSEKCMNLWDKKTLEEKATNIIYYSTLRAGHQSNTVIMLPVRLGDKIYRRTIWVSGVYTPSLSSLGGEYEKICEALDEYEYTTLVETPKPVSTETILETLAIPIYKIARMEISAFGLLLQVEIEFGDADSFKDFKDIRRDIEEKKQKLKQLVQEADKRLEQHHQRILESEKLIQQLEQQGLIQDG